MTDFNLTDFYTLYGEGIGIGIALSFFPFLVGYLVQSVLSIIKKS